MNIENFSFCMFSLFNFSSIFPGGQLTPFAPVCGYNHGFLGSPEYRVHPRNGISIGSAVLAQVRCRPRNIGNNSPHHCTAPCMRCGLAATKVKATVLTASNSLQNLPFLQILPTAAPICFFTTHVLHGFPGLFTDTSEHIRFFAF